MPHSITYSQLAEALHALPKERLQDMVTVYDPNKDEHIAVVEAKPLHAAVLDLHPKTRCYNTTFAPGHLCLVLKA